MRAVSLASAASICIGLLPVVDGSSVTLSVNASAVVSTVDPEYISANFDWHTAEEEYPAWVNSSVLTINLTDPRLITLASAFAPAHLRVGGSEQDGEPGARGALTDPALDPPHAPQTSGMRSTAPARRRSTRRSA